MNKNIKALVFDVDNTITKSCQEITDEMTSILSNFPVEIGFLSGTTVLELKRMISSKLKRKHHLLGNTGTHYIILENGNENELINEELSIDEKENIINALKKLKKKYNLIPLTSEEDQIQDRGSQVTLSILGRNAPSKSKSRYDPLNTKRTKFIKFLRNFLDENYEIKIGGTTSIDITKKGYDKFWAMNNFMRIHNLDKNEILFFGDQLQEGGNDYPVIKTGIKCIEVKNPKETLEILKKIFE